MCTVVKKDGHIRLSDWLCAIASHLQPILCSIHKNRGFRSILTRKGTSHSRQVYGPSNIIRSLHGKCQPQSKNQQSNATENWFQEINHVVFHGNFLSSPTVWGNPEENLRILTQLRCVRDEELIPKVFTHGSISIFPTCVDHKDHKYIKSKVNFKIPDLNFLMNSDAHNSSSAPPELYSYCRMAYNRSFMPPAKNGAHSTFIWWGWKSYPRQCESDGPPSRMREIYGDRRPSNAMPPT